MNFYTAVLFAFSIFLPALVAMYRFENINRIYYPFLVLLWIAAMNELLSFLLLMNRLPNFINNNVYGLIESMLIVLLFKNLGVLHNRKKLFYTLIAALLAVWLIENVVFSHLEGIGVYFRLTSSLAIVLLSISMLNISLVDTKMNVFKNPDFLICTCYIVYFTFRIIIEMFWLYGLNSSDRFQLLVYELLNYVNLICNLIFMFAVLWMPRKQVFIMR